MVTNYFADRLIPVSVSGEKAFLLRTELFSAEPNLKGFRIHATAYSMSQKLNLYFIFVQLPWLGHLQEDTLIPGQQFVFVL